MQLNVERGAPATGKTIRLREKARAAGQDEQQIIAANFYTNSDLELLIRHRVSRGAKIICIDACNEEQIRQLTALQERLPSELTIHAVALA
jgi:hypothetical protein